MFANEVRSEKVIVKCYFTYDLQTIVSNIFIANVLLSEQINSVNLQHTAHYITNSLNSTV
jgi:hypothetical protein